MATERKKVISIGGDYGDADITRVQAIVDHPDFQRLQSLGQLTPLNLVFPGATHTRFTHCLRVFDRVRRSSRFVDQGILTSDDHLNLSIYGLCHDIFHGPFSHLLEPLYPDDHDAYAKRAIGRLADAIARCGGNYEAVRALFARTDQRYKIVHDKNVGIEKLDYLYYDTFYCGYGGRPEVNALYDYANFLPDVGEMSIDIARAEELKAFQEAYVRTYKQIYFRKQSVILTRLFQKMGALVLNSGAAVETMRHWTDDEFLGYAAFAKDPMLQALYAAYRERRIPKVAVSLRPPNEAILEPTQGKKMWVQAVYKEKLAEFCGWDIPRITAAERDIAAITGFLPHQILLVTQMRPDRFVPKDIIVTDKNERYHLAEMYPRHFENLREIAESTLFVRVAVLSDDESGRERVFRAAEEIIKYLLETAR